MTSASHHLQVTRPPHTHLVHARDEGRARVTEALDELHELGVVATGHQARAGERDVASATPGRVLRDLEYDGVACAQARGDVVVEVVEGVVPGGKGKGRGGVRWCGPWVRRQEPVDAWA